MLASASWCSVCSRCAPHARATAGGSPCLCVCVVCVLCVCVCSCHAQMDIHTPAQTVVEALMFSARLRLPKSVSDEDVSCTAHRHTAQHRIHSIQAQTGRHTSPRKGHHARIRCTEERTCRAPRSPYRTAHTFMPCVCVCLSDPKCVCARLCVCIGACIRGGSDGHCRVRTHSV